MRARITEIREARTYGGATKAYIEKDTVLHEMADEWFNRHKVWGLEFKCKTWAKVRRALTVPVGKALVEALANGTTAARWTATCGCACGCSPGWRVADYRGATKNIHFEVVDVTAAEAAEFKKLLAKADGLLKAELEVNMTDEEVLKTIAI